MTIGRSPEDLDMLMSGFVSIGISLYNEIDQLGEPEEESLLDRKREVWTREFWAAWEELDDDGQERLREWARRCGHSAAFDRVLSDAEDRDRVRMLAMSRGEFVADLRNRLENARSRVEAAHAEMRRWADRHADAGRRGDE